MPRAQPRRLLSARFVMGLMTALMSLTGVAAEDRIDAPRAQYLVTVREGVSHAVTELLLGEHAVRRYSASAKDSESETSLRVSSGQPAYIESGRVLRAIDRIYVGFHGAGFDRREISLTRGFAVTATARGEGMVELAIQPFSVTEGASQLVREVHSLETSMLLPLGRWTLVSAGSARVQEGVRRYETEQALEHGNTLIRVEPVPDTAR